MVTKSHYITYMEYIRRDKCQAYPDPLESHDQSA